LSQITEASEASSANVQLKTELELSANIQLQTEHANRQLNLTTSTNRQSELADRHTERHIELAKRKIEHANGQIERNDEHTPKFVKWQVEWQIGQAEKQFEQADGQTESIDWPINLIEIITKVMNSPCKTPHPPEFTFKLSEATASHNQEILKKYNNNLSEALKANENTFLGYRSENGCHKNSKRFLISTPYGCKWNPSSETEANNHCRKSAKRIGNKTSKMHPPLTTTKAHSLNGYYSRN
jgi:hypothetical protein